MENIKTNFNLNMVFNENNIFIISNLMFLFDPTTSHYNNKSLFM